LSANDDARRIIKDVIVELINEYGFTRETIGQYIDKDIIDDVFRAIEANKNYPNNINELLHDFNSKSFSIASTAKSIRDVGLDNTDKDFQEAVVELIDLIDRLAPKIKITLRLIRTARQRGKYLS